MEYTKDDIKNLQSWRKIIDSDNIRYKEIIKSKLLDNKDIIHVLNNKELESLQSEPDEYYGVNILPYYLVSPTQVDVQNFICYETAVKELQKFNTCMKYLEITFYILCEKKTAIDSDTYIARHDLLGALVLDEFNWKTYFGNRIHCVSDVPSVVDNDYLTRTLIFQQITDNNLVKTKNDITQFINKDVAGV